MANHYSALKRARQTNKRTAINRRNLTQVRHQIRALRRALKSNDATAVSNLTGSTISAIDRAAQKGVLKKNTAARYKSRLMHRVSALQAPAPAA